MKHQHQLSGIAKALAAHGRKGDTELIHVSKKELAALEKYGEGIGIHLTTNPTTGLPEAFNWGGTIGSIAVPLAVLAATAATGGAAAPWMLAAAGAAGGAGGTMLGGGSTDEALMSGVMGGIGGYGMGSLAGNVAAEGAKAAAAEASTQALTNVGTEAAAGQGATSLLGSAGSTIPGVTPGVAYSTPTSLLGADSVSIAGGTGSSLLGNTGTAAQAMLPGATTPLTGMAANTAGTMLPGATTPLAAQAAPMTGMQQMGAGLNAITSSPSAFGNFAMDNASNVGMMGIGAMGAGTTSQPTGTIYTEPENTGSNYTAEWYTDPATGQRRTRAVAKAEGGMAFSDYDAADVGADGGYAPGGVATFNEGGGASASPATVGNYRAEWYTDPATGQQRTRAVETPSIQSALRTFFPAGGSRNGVPNENVAAALMRMFGNSQKNMASGGISDLGGYSDGGRLLRGPGDGVSDNIPASIEGKRPARLADGEFVVPARAVSELGNGSTEAGSKQLYKMLDRIAAKRKKGKGLAYEANPKKLLPA